MSIGMLSVERFLGRRNGISAPNFLLIAAISLSSVYTITELKIFESRADSIVYAMSGLPANILIFFFGTRFEPPRAAIRQIGFISKL